MPIEDKIGNIPLFITEMHQHSYAHWNIEDATLLHIDAHPDSHDGARMGRKDVTEDSLNVWNFISAAVHTRKVREFYWYNPQLENELVRHMGSRHSVISNLRTTEIRGNIVWDLGSNYANEEMKFGYSYGLVMRVESLRVKKPFLLDIDLDAFCCDRSMPLYDIFFSVENFMHKINMTAGMLKTLPKPDIITVTRSQGSDIYVPKNKVKLVEKYLLESLKEIYS
jgi:hypothetical protein